MVNLNALHRFEAFYADFDQVIDLNGQVIQNNVHRYMELKQLLHQVDVSENAYYQSRYSYFYGLNRALNAGQKAAYYLRLEVLKDAYHPRENPIDVTELTEEMVPSLGKRHFSFCTKLANMVDDDIYPIYDKNVAKVFHRRGLGYGMQYKENIFIDIRDTYNELRSHQVTELFKNRFNAQEMGTMKALDTLFWVMGR